MTKRIKKMGIDAGLKMNSIEKILQGASLWKREKCLKKSIVFGASLK